jgi:two-component system chemotaxis response regulator CheB
MTNRNILALGMSAGGVEALLFLAKRLPRNFPAAVLVTLHLPSHTRSGLDELLTRAGHLPAVFGRDGDSIEEGRIHIARPGRHLLLDDDRLLLGNGPRENNARPAIDPMLRSVALCCGVRAIGAVLTGTMGDGASGLWAVQQCGGMTVVQDPSDAAFPEMPLNAMGRLRPDHVVSLAEMPNLFESLVSQSAGKPVTTPAALKYEVEIAKGGRGSMSEMDRIGRRSVLACPDCNGVMWEINEGDLVRYRCHVGHGYTSELMSLALEENLRRALASALRALEERVALAEKMYRQAREWGHNHAADTWATRKQEYADEAQVIRDAIRRCDETAARAA